jgi:hypothetical protein
MMYRLIILAAILAIAGCAPAKIGLEPQDWNDKQEYSVKGRQGILIKQKLSFGEFKTATVKRSWTRGSSSFDGWVWRRPGHDDYYRVGTEYSNRKQTLRFDLTDNNANESSVFCITKAHSQDFVVGRSANSLLNIVLDILRVEDASDNMFFVKVYLKNDEQPWEMIIDNEAAQAKSKTYTGVIAQSKDKYYTIHPVYKIAGKNDKLYTMPIGSVGYEIRNKDGKPLAAISTMDNGKVYLKPMPAEEKFLLANICTALLLQENI